MTAHVAAWWRDLDDETRQAITWGPLCAVLLPLDFLALMLLGGHH